jgi:hypothetical protein
VSVVEPFILERLEHPISRRDIDAKALKVHYRLINAGQVAYLVGGSVRDPAHLQAPPIERHSLSEGRLDANRVAKPRNTNSSGLARQVKTETRRGSPCLSVRCKVH